MDIARCLKPKSFEASEMSTKYLNCLTIDDGALMPPSQFVDVSFSSLIRIFETINKTWHADCRTTAVSKILDWLVK